MLIFCFLVIVGSASIIIGAERALRVPGALTCRACGVDLEPGDHHYCEVI